MRKYYLELFEKYPEAEGIDFIPFSATFSPLGIPDEIIQRNLKKDFEKDIAVPKTCFLLWKIKNGRRVYLDWDYEE